MERVMKSIGKYIVGIDEVGRGPLAGPVVLATVAFPRGLRLRAGGGRVPLKDSKKLTAIQRALWADYLINHKKIFFSLSSAAPKTIDRINVARAANGAALRAFKKLSKIHHIKSNTYAIYLDGGLYLGNRKARDIPAKTMVRADEKITAVKAASVIAKVHRDRIMVHAAKRYPQYGFEVHKGYGTKKHREAIRKHGPSSIHRLTFIKNHIS